MALIVSPVNESLRKLFQFINKFQIAHLDQSNRWINLLKLKLPASISMEVVIS
ncbi:hypothetical protein COO91_01234 [Nostoc flagelliforme CCNUN1]|uniref:Uncharacterized protein n=1 Tax=Nostoc flagelliforme CCNUN1 TaxID=2038116 RepID=A0A2K8SIP7_9NOSO|nr:hypothetical protein COO91_01234 [Nostoc flagelliforme CCNUN1]